MCGNRPPDNHQRTQDSCGRIGKWPGMTMTTSNNSASIISQVVSETGFSIWTNGMGQPELPNSYHGPFFAESVAANFNHVTPIFTTYSLQRDDRIRLSNGDITSVFQRWRFVFLNARPIHPAEILQRRQLLGCSRWCPEVCSGSTWSVTPGCVSGLSATGSLPGIHALCTPDTGSRGHRPCSLEKRR